jgi:hypothetical protein
MQSNFLPVGSIHLNVFAFGWLVITVAPWAAWLIAAAGKINEEPNIKSKNKLTVRFITYYDAVSYILNLEQFIIIVASHLFAWVE